MPDFIGGDIKFAFVVDGEKTNTLPEKGNNYHLIKSECTNGANVTWNEITWSANVSNLKETGTACTLTFDKQTTDYNYGDSSLNEVENGYNDKIVFKSLTGNNISTRNYNNHPGINYIESNINEVPSAESIRKSLSSENNGGYHFNITKGENETPISRVSSSNSIITVQFGGGGYGFNSISNIKLYLNNTYYTLKEAVNNKLIKPIVLIFSTSNNANSSKINTLSTYSGGKASINTWGFLHIYFMLENDVVFSKIKFTADNDFNPASDGISVYEFPNTIMYLK